MQQSEIHKFINQLRDESSDLEKYVDLLYELQRNSGPIAEVLTILKNDKPVIYSLLRKRVSKNPGLNMLFDLSMRYEQAVQNIGHK